MVMGTPWNTPQFSPFAKAASASRALSNACSSINTIIALIFGFYFFILSRIICVSSKEEIFFIRISLAASAALKKGRLLFLTEKELPKPG
jgi:hypothetical protein